MVRGCCRDASPARVGVSVACSLEHAARVLSFAFIFLNVDLHLRPDMGSFYQIRMNISTLSISERTHVRHR